jgi:hypothetical protein
MVALFPEHNNKYSVIPTNWIQQNENQTNYYYWPPGNVDSDILQEAEDPRPNWKMYRIKIYSRNNIFDKDLCIINIKLHII